MVWGRKAQEIFSKSLRWTDRLVNRLLTLNFVSFDTEISTWQLFIITNGNGEGGGSVVECRTPEREVGGSRPTAAVLCPWARHFTPRKYWLITQEVVALSRHDWKIVDWDVKPQHKQTNGNGNIYGRYMDVMLLELFVPTNFVCVFVCTQINLIVYSHCFGWVNLIRESNQINTQHKYAAYMELCYHCQNICSLSS